MKIGYVLSCYPRLSETFVSREIEAHIAAGFPPEIFSLKRSDNPLNSVRYGSLVRSFSAVLFWLCRNPLALLGVIGVFLVDLVHLKFRVFATNIAILLYSLDFAKVAADRQLEHLHAHFLWGGGTAAWIMSRMTGIPFSLTVHAFDIFDPALEDHAASMKVRDAAFIAAISEYNRRLLLERSGSSAEKVYVVHCGVPESFLDYHSERQPAKDDGVVIFSVGRLTGKKGFDILIQSVARLRTKGIDVTCHIAGAGELDHLLRTLARESGVEDLIVFHGALPNEAVMARLRNADIFALPCIVTESGDMDGIPVVLMEAMALGVPVVSTNISGIPELIEDHVNGLLVPQKNVELLADALEELVCSESLRIAMGDGARKRIEKDFTVESNAMQLRQLFSKVRVNHATHC